MDGDVDRAPYVIHGDEQAWAGVLGGSLDPLVALGRRITGAAARRVMARERSRTMRDWRQLSAEAGGSLEARPRPVWRIAGAARMFGVHSA
jgi:hypothetical protein